MGMRRRPESRVSGALRKEKAAQLKSTGTHGDCRTCWSKRAVTSVSELTGTFGVWAKRWLNDSAPVILDPPTRKDFGCVGMKHTPSELTRQRAELGSRNPCHAFRGRTVVRRADGHQ